MKKSDFLNEACKTTAINVRCLCGDLTILINACHEAAAYRLEHKLPHAEKYVAMEDKLKLLSEDLDQRIDNKCDCLLRIAKTHK